MAHHPRNDAPRDTTSLHNRAPPLPPLSLASVPICRLQLVPLLQELAGGARARSTSRWPSFLGRASLLGRWHGLILDCCEETPTGFRETASRTTSLARRFHCVSIGIFVFLSVYERTRLLWLLQGQGRCISVCAPSAYVGKAPTPKPLGSLYDRDARLRI